MLLSSRARSSGIGFLAGWVLGIVILDGGRTLVAVAMYTVIAASTVAVPVIGFAIIGKGVAPF
ncbi:hypothetical protein ASF62_08720 [Leifsonia sp. Leaf325]|nr:hypothetical protein [Leifsonia sp. Leaf325]KQQ94211.1 hypothetical protein ASF62_08720 [Leifsonia sp. Leaf325]